MDMDMDMDMDFEHGIFHIHRQTISLIQQQLVVHIHDLSLVVL
jgi:hypothetical protein